MSIGRRLKQASERMKFLKSFLNKIVSKMFQRASMIIQVTQCPFISFQRTTDIEITVSSLQHEISSLKKMNLLLRR